MSGDGFDLVLARSAERALARLPEKVATAVLETLPAIAENPHRLGKPLRFELEGLRVARLGTYRIIYEVDESHRLVTVLKIAHRADVYRP